MNGNCLNSIFLRIGQSLVIVRMVYNRNQVGRRQQLFAAW